MNVQRFVTLLLIGALALLLAFVARASKLIGKYDVGITGWSEEQSNKSPSVINEPQQPSTKPEVTPSFKEKTPTPASETHGETYHVSGVKPSDRLYVRKRPEAESPSDGWLAHNTNQIVITGEAVLNGITVWVPIKIDGYEGWVNRAYLTPDKRRK